MTPEIQESVLKRVVWSALTSRQSRFSVGDAKARRFDPAITPFAASIDNSEAALASLAQVLGDEDDHVYLLQAEEVGLPDSIETVKSALGVLMIEQLPGESPSLELGIHALSLADVPDMVELAELTQPGPFTARTPEIGSFWGIRRNGKLAAMAGTRLNLDGYTEVSGICTHPGFRGHGFASALSRFVAAQIRARGDRPFLHAYADNHGAIALYRKLGYDIWSEVNVAVIRRKPAVAAATDPGT
ncbi:MAG: GNAT family N-acetyltransferase [Roseibium sp.]|uniref:GNAT family N-acetyltransferase n=1 Tax=Roseibium sp. TaxID=1936156 RepID=UPI001B212996|nr:GNAT family N-acetyltransferase [Roseibium sp.]MBO6890790.1 GNAT family N-acetyltransferase [Roseibium sp.]MBO6932694.1 GNAT family N-acetyltransferase [Roseibium sp.]